MLDTDQLRSFVAIVDTGSFTRAAQRVNKTQSTVSMHIRRLEERLGKPLFLKEGRGVRLSEGGERLTEYARTILHAEAAAFESITGRGLRGQIRFGFPDDYAEVFISEIMKRFSMRHPLAEMLVVSENSSLLIEQVRKGDIDVAIVTVTESMPGAEIIREEPLRWVAGPNKPVENERPLPLAIGTAGCRTRTLATRKLTEAGIPIKYVLTSSNYTMVSSTVEAGLALTILPEGFVPKRLRIVPDEAGLPELELCRIGLITAPTSRVEGLDTLAALVREIVGR